MKLGGLSTLRMWSTRECQRQITIEGAEAMRAKAWYESLCFYGDQSEKGSMLALQPLSDLILAHETHETHCTHGHLSRCSIIEMFYVCYDLYVVRLSCLNSNQE